MRGTETIIVHRSGGRDPDGDPLPGEPDRTIEKCLIVPRTSTEEGRGEVIIEGKNIFCPPGSDVQANDEVTAQGVRYEVDGVPGFFGPKRPLWVIVKRRGT